jgi:hypothetical protein
MRRRTVLIVLSAAAAALAIAGAVVWLTATPYSETVSHCKAALVAQTKAGGKGRPAACKDVKDDDYADIVMANVLDGMSKKDKDLLDYYDDGHINGSIG